MIKFLDLQAQYHSIKSEIDSVMHQVLEDSSFIGGKYVAQFEKEFSDFVQTKHCIGVGNGTDALEIAIEALDLPSESEIIVPANSFIATSESVTRSGHKVVFADYCSETYVISVHDVEKKLTSKTKAIVAVHLYGHSCDMEALQLLCNKYELFLIEDCAQAHGTAYMGRQVGGIGDIATFSFYPGKTLGAFGDGGAITTNNSALAEQCRMIANHGRLTKYDHKFEGRNSRLDALQAGILSVKLKYLPNWIEQRRTIADQYRDELELIGEVVLPKQENWCEQSYHLFVIRAENRDMLRNFLSESLVETGIHYPKLLPNLTAYSQMRVDTSFKDYGGELLSLPIGEHIENADITHVSCLIKEFYGR